MRTGKYYTRFYFDDYNGLNDVSGAPYYHGVAINDVCVHDGILTLKNAMAVTWNEKFGRWEHSGVRPADFNAVEVGSDQTPQFPSTKY